MDALITVAMIGTIFATLIVAVVSFQRSLDQPGGREGLGSVGDAFGNMIDVFDPGQARAARDLKAQEHKGPVAPSPDDDDDRPVRVILGPDGRPKAVQIRPASQPGRES